MLAKGLSSCALARAASTHALWRLTLTRSSRWLAWAMPRLPGPGASPYTSATSMVWYGMVWYGMIEVCEGAVAKGGWVLTDGHNLSTTPSSVWTVFHPFFIMLAVAPAVRYLQLHQLCDTSGRDMARPPTLVILHCQNFKPFFQSSGGTRFMQGQPQTMPCQRKISVCSLTCVRVRVWGAANAGAGATR